MKKVYNRFTLLIFFQLLLFSSYAVNVTFNVTVPAGTQEVYIIGSSDYLGNWGANEGRAILMEQTGTTSWSKTLFLPPNTTYQYMFLCGPNWKYEQSPNTNFPFTTGATDMVRNNTILAWNETPPPYVRFSFLVNVPSDTENVFLIGSDELGNWDADTGRARKMRKVSDGLFSTSVRLAPNKSYQYKYLCAAANDFAQTGDAFTVNTTSQNSTVDTVDDWRQTPEYNSGAQHYLKRQGDKIVDAQGDDFIIRAIGLGNYMVWEPYMWKVSNYENAGIMKKIIDRMRMVLHEEDLQFFVSEYMNNYITKRDVDSLKAWGFNAIRLPMHYNLFINSNPSDNSFIERGFELTEQLRQWCEVNEMYLILDLHAAPGGQGFDTAIADSYGPGLWEGNTIGTAEQYQTKVVLLWKEIARRFSQKNWIGGYDLLNETNYSDYQAGGRQLSELKLLELFKRCVNQIRLYDQHNIIYLEGNGWANDFSSIVPPFWGDDWDENMAYSPHKYWAPHGSFAGENLKALYNMPLFLGETGENSNEWFYQTVKSAESKNIGWAWWSYKKIDNISGFLSIKSSDSFQKIIDFVNNGTGLSPDSKTENFDYFLDFLENVKIENCEINRDVLFALVGQQADGTATKPYGANLVPGVIHASEYDLGRHNYAYFENNTSDNQVIENVGGQNTVYNSGWAGRNDAVDIEKTSGVADSKSNGYNIGWTNTGEWVQYTVFAQTAGIYNVALRHASTQSSVVSLRDRNNLVKIEKQLASTSGWQNWQITNMGNLEMEQGWNTLRLFFNNGGVNVNYLTFDFVSASSVVDGVKQKNQVTIKDYTLGFNGYHTNFSGTVYSLTGSSIGSFNGVTSYDFTHLPRGVYLYTIINDKNHSFSGKFIR